MTKRGARAFFVVGTLGQRADLRRAHHRQPPPDPGADQRLGHRRNGGGGQGCVAPAQLHQLPHPPRRGRVLRARPHPDHRPAGRGVPARVPEGSLALLLRGARWPAHAHTQALRPGDHGGHRVPRVGQQDQHAGLAPRPILVEGQRGARRQRRRSAGDGRLQRSRRARPRGVQRDAAWVLGLSLHRPRRQHRGPDHGRDRHHRRGPACAPGTTGDTPRTPPAYIRESIVDPNAHVLTGPTYAAGGRSLMPGDYAQSLKPEQVDQIVAYLLTLK